MSITAEYTTAPFVTGKFHMVDPAKVNYATIS